MSMKSIFNLQRGRRTALAFAAGLATALAVSWTSPAHADAPLQKNQVPGYFREQLGAFEVTALNDGQIMLDTKILHHATPKELQHQLDEHVRPNPVPTSVNAFLVNTGGKLVLVDTGAASLFGPGMGLLQANLKAAGYTPEQVDVILITHFHGDHVGGLPTADGKPAFPNATVYAAQAEVDFWLSPEQTAKAPEGMQGFFKMAQGSLKPYVEANRLKTFSSDVEIVPGVKAIATHAHTPGHTSYLFESQGQKLLVLGDLIHFSTVQFDKPGVSIDFDSDQKNAVPMRQKIFTWAAKDKLLVAGAHLPFPGLGNIRTEGKKSFAWIPVDYAPLK